MKIAAIALFIVVIVVLFISSISVEDNSNTILIDAGKPKTITWPCEIDIVGENGEEGFKIGPEVSQGWRTKKWNNEDEGAESMASEGSAVYYFYAPAEGDYVIWAYALWDDPCTNAVYAKIDDEEDYIIGNDPIYKEWHWVRGFNAHLTKGTHKLTLSNHSNNIAIQQLILIGSKYRTPSDCEVYSIDLFYDDLNGCDQGNYHLWETITGDWGVSAYDKLACTNENILFGTSKAEKDAVIRINGPEWEAYSFDLDIYLKEYSDNSYGEIFFGCNNQKTSFSIKITPKPDSKLLQLLRYENSSVHMLGEGQISMDNFTLSMIHDGNIHILVDDNEVISSNSPTIEIQGGIKIKVYGDSVLCFDNIHVRRSLEDIVN